MGYEIVNKIYAEINGVSIPLEIVCRNSETNNVESMTILEKRNLEDKGILFHTKNLEMTSLTSFVMENNEITRLMLDSSREAKLFEAIEEIKAKGYSSFVGTPNNPRQERLIRKVDEALLNVKNNT